MTAMFPKWAPGAKVVDVVTNMVATIVERAARAVGLAASLN